MSGSPYSRYDPSKVIPLRGLDNGGDEPPGGSQLEARVKVMEDRMDRFESKLDTLSHDVASIKGEMKRLPGYPGLFVISAALVGVVGLLVRFL